MLSLDYSDIKRILCELVLIVALGVVVGLSANVGLLQRVLSGQGVPLLSESETAERNDSYPEPVSLQQTKQLIADKAALIVDARIGELYEQGHLPHAVSLPLSEADRRLPELQAEVAPDRPILVYCNGYGCPDSFDLAMKLIAAGYRRVLVFEGGFPEWRDAGLPIEVTESGP
ncbi:rhodanese-related sulfurtransferase [Geothermobacter ehrlichii]|uniref:Sulfurtransferase n=1 Tax=Geothermobacter ehrlichii TaxID=213224 RepID=A0A5D3WJ76_9BACT|nr:rhodanese-like domain-containing protein [Geothermobacter ehrlichii]TYO98983.1 rhodanese-related sulfurtransferase [Geothermobacter ehrlichii]